MFSWGTIGSNQISSQTSVHCYSLILVYFLDTAQILLDEATSIDMNPSHVQKVNFPISYFQNLISFLLSYTALCPAVMCLCFSHILPKAAAGKEPRIGNVKVRITPPDRIESFLASFSLVLIFTKSQFQNGYRYRNSSQSISIKRKR